METWEGWAHQWPLHIYMHIYRHIHYTHTHTSTDMVTPTRLMRRELICESDGATFVKSDSQLRQPGLGDNSLPVRLCVQYMRVHVCVCVWAWARSTQEWILGSYSHLFALYLHSLDINFRAVLQHRAQVVSVIHLGVIQNGHEKDRKSKPCLPKWEAYFCKISAPWNNGEVFIHNILYPCFILQMMYKWCASPILGEAEHKDGK